MLGIVYPYKLSRRDGCGKSDENSLIVQTGECRPTAHSVWQPPEGAYFVGEGLLPTERVSWPLSRRHGYLPRCLSKNSAISPNATAVSGRAIVEQVLRVPAARSARCTRTVLLSSRSRVPLVRMAGVELHLNRRHTLEGIHDLNAVIVVFKS